VLSSQNYDLEQLAKLTGAPGLARLPGGECGECAKEVRFLFVLGRFALCRTCAERRLRLGLEVKTFDSKTAHSRGNRR
jgi:hypothetical protein